MNESRPPRRDLLAVSRELKSIAEAGLRYGNDPYDLERYRRLHEIASELPGAVAAGFRWPVETGYATPKVDVRGAVIDARERVLLVRERASGLWALPGGWADLNASPAENVARELREEAGLEVEVRKLVACWDKDHQGHPRQPEHVYKLLFLCHARAEVRREELETDGVGWFPLSGLPPLCPYRSARHYLELALRHAREPALPAEFD